jgi:HlyD family secretion protein
MSRSLPAPVGIALVLAGLAAGCARDDGGAVLASGQIEATEVRLATKVAGVVAAIAVEEGDSVRAGQVVAMLDTVDLALARRQAAADLAQAEAGLDLARAGSRAEDIAAARAAVAQKRSDFDGAERDDIRAEALLASGSVSAKARDDARVRRDMAAAALAQAQEAERRAVRGSRPEEIAAARAARDRAAARLEAVAQQVADATVRAPLDGIVSEKLVEAGELVGAGSGIAIITDITHPWLTAFVTGEDLPRLRLGGKARVTTDARGDAGHDGVVAAIASTAEFTPRNVQTRDERARLVYRVKIRLENADGRFKPGMPADARIEAAPAR